jgi:uncharacterized protein (TIGR03790 family)
VRSALVLALVLASPSLARATPAPDSVAVLANADVPGSVALAARYAEARSVPASQVCLLSLPTGADMTFEEFDTRLRQPFDACLGAVRDRIEAVVIVRGVPIRTGTPSGARISVAAALGVWDSTLPDGSPVLGSPPGIVADCGGTPCLRARLPNTYGGEPFRAGWAFETSDMVHRPVLVTMLHGRTDADAESLLDVALAADEAGGAAGPFLLMRGADPARGSLDRTYPGVERALVERGMTVLVEDFASDTTGRAFAGFITGTASLGATIEGNGYTPGALVDNLTSFGAVPENFAASGEVQVSIARWVAAGVAGVHGTVDEPLNNCFPMRELLVDYVDGATLAEAYLGRMPYAYWMNLVLGDPMLAPYAERPVVTIEGPAEGSRFEAAQLVVSATPPEGRALASLILYVDGVEVARSPGGPITHCLAPDEAGEVSVLAVARTAFEPALPRPYPGAGWAHIVAQAEGGATGCAAPDAGPLDAAAPDAGPTSPADAGVVASSAGCGCRAAGRGPSPFGPLLLVLVLVARRVTRSA